MLTGMRHVRLILPIAVAVAAATLAAQRAPETAIPSTFFDGAQLLRDLKTLSADDMEGRQVGTAGGEKARAYVLARFKAAGLAPFNGSFTTSFTFTSGGRGTTPPVERTGVNVIGRIDGRVPSSRYLVVSAHYDHVGVRNGQVFNGADDNASGTAALFAVAQYFRSHPTAHNMIVVAFDGEEAGLRGSQAFVANPPVPKDQIAIDLNADMIGRDPDDKLFVVGTRTQPDLKPYIDRVAARAKVKLLTGHETPGEKEDWTNDSDHAAFRRANIPALYFGVEDFDQHHAATDDYDTMSHDFYVKAVETLILAIQEFDSIK